ncbi:MAG TPA: pyridoxamine 5'-phosphate oxidase family protein [Rectinemataceae bacterium]|nr:pyridoxamine 5'-phosphate oxidase family protein [Rectinemataceae bacterium]
MRDIPFSAVRRKDRAVEDTEWLRALLHRAPMGILATSRDGQPSINTRHFAFDDEAGAIYLHGAKSGRTIDDIGLNDRVCFSASEIGRQLPASKAFDFGSEYASVVVYGRAAIVEDEAEARRALELILAKYFPHLAYGRDYAPIADKELSATAVIRVTIEEWSGKRKVAGADHAGAFPFGQPPA